MRKFLSFFAVALMALSVNAAVINIDNTTADALRKALNNAQSGDIIEMAAGTYVESPENYIAFTGKEVVVRAAEGAEVIIQPQVPIRLKTGARAEFIGIKFDCGHLSDVNSYSHMIVPADDTEGKKVILNNCEFFGWTQNSSLIQTPDSRRLDSLVINNCYFHDCVKSALHYTNANLVGLEIKNSTFANIDGPADGYWAAPIYIEATTGSILIDHCTFYNVKSMSLSYGVITTVIPAVVSNCIMVLPESVDMCATNLPEGGLVKNTLTYNYSNWQEYGHYNTATKQDCIWADPLFVDAANANFTLGVCSPALAAADDGGAIGDPRWVPAIEPVEPQMKTIYCKMDKDWWIADNAAVGVYTWDDCGNQKVVWPGERMAPVEGEEHMWSFELDINKYKMCIFTRLNAEGEVADWGAKSADLIIPTDDKNLFTISNNEPCWNGNECACAGEWSVYGAEPVQPTLVNGFYLVGTINDWTPAAEYHLVGNPENPAEFMVSATLADGDEIKVVNVVDDNITAWYPGNDAGNYVVDAAHAGEKTVYFQPDYKEDWAAFGGFFYIAPNEEPVAEEWAEILFVEPVSADNLAANATFSLLGSEFSAQITDPDNKMSIDANNCRFGTPEAFMDYTHRLKTGGKTNENVTKNFITLNIPAAGQLRIAVRTGSNGATDRNLVITQGENELFNRVIKEDDKQVIETVTYYPYVIVPVAAGQVVISYPVNGMNIYAFAFLAGDEPQVLDAPDAAPAAPEYPIYQVKPVYSAAYEADCNFGEWGSGTAYTQEEYGKKYVTNNMGYFGLEFTGMDCSAMEALHMDVWIAADASIRIVPIHGGTEVGVTAQLVGQQWNSVEIPLSAFEGVANWSNVYQIKIDNASNLTFWLNNVYFYTTVAPTLDLVDGYYLIGPKGWTVYDLAAADKFEANTGIEGEYMLSTILEEGKEFKVVAVAENAITAWYPEGMDNNYVVDRAHAGEKIVYFRPDGQGGEGWHEGCIYVPKTEDLSPITAQFWTYGWAEDNLSTAVWDAENKKINVNIALGKSEQWQAQVKYYGPVAETGKCYHVALKMTANKAINDVIAKYQDNGEMVMVKKNLAANVEFVLDTVVPGVPGNGVLVFDFGFAEAETMIEISNIVIEETACTEPQPEVNYYLVGTITEWAVVADEAHLFVATEVEGEYMLATTLAEGDGIKVVGVEGANQTWYPDGMGNEYVVDAAHAGRVIIYFRPAGNADWSAFGGYIYVDVDHTGIDNTAAEMKAVKTIINGQLFIEKNGKLYNAQGAIVR